MKLKFISCIFVSTSILNFIFFFFASEYFDSIIPYIAGWFITVGFNDFELDIWCDSLIKSLT